MNTSTVNGSVVIGVDGSGSSDGALAWAVRHAAQSGRPLLVLYAAGYPGVFSQADDLLAAEHGLMSIGTGIVSVEADRARELAPRLLVHTKVTLGDPPHVLAEAAESASLVVVGARGRSPAAALLLGSVSLSLISRVHCPVVVVRAGTDLAGDGVRAVVVGVDGTRASRTAVEFAFRQASYDGAPLTVAHATWDPLPYSAAIETALTQAEKEVRLEQEELPVAETIAGLSEKYPDVQVEQIYRNGDPAKILADLSRDASLVVVGSRGHRAPVTTLIGSVGRRLVEHAQCPVAIVSP